MKQDIRFILPEKCGISVSNWQECLDEHARSSQPLVELVVQRNLANEEVFLKAAGACLGLDFVELSSRQIAADVIKSVPVRLVTHYRFMPLEMRDETLLIAVNDPFDTFALDDIRLFLGRPVRPAAAAHRDIVEAIKRFYGVGAETLEAMKGDAFSEEERRLSAAKSASGGSITDEARDPSVIKLLNQVLLDAIRQRATDIHFEPFENDLRVRYRIDGILYEIPSPESLKHFQSAIATRIKVMANLDIAERRRPQDGRVDVQLDDDTYDLRISVMPTPFGESIGIRILRRSAPDITLENLGLAEAEFSLLMRMIRQPHGIILVTGPTGSGKTTTLYACINRINSAQRKILTIEDPIEYQLKGVTQMQIEPRIDFTFANALRSMLRHDPDVMMVGEIRDSETAEIAVRTALTGHLVFSTLHTNDAAGAITRLLDMGIDPFLVASSVNLIVAQRLVRVTCSRCSTAVSVKPELLRQFTDSPPGQPLKQGKGCDHCRMTGYQGRTGIFEMLVLTDEIKELILRKASAHRIREQAVSQGMKLLKEAGWEKVTRGETTLEEIVRVTHEVE
ncbi:MAG: GspE/PulE family protein [Candidatus Omnitrophica bacterium]|nr:GspE/PulE family protein [Candidatus Omnitrophota bacterium]